MSVRDALRAILHGEVDAVYRGSDHIDMLRERERERRSRREQLRSTVTEHPALRAVVQERRDRLER